MSRKLAVRRRLLYYSDFLAKYGYITRKDIMRIGEVSSSQATHDIKMLLEDYPSLELNYDLSAKYYRTKCECVTCDEARRNYRMRTSS